MTPGSNGMQSKIGASVATPAVKPAASAVRPVVKRPLSAVMPVPAIARPKPAYQSSGQFPNVKMPIPPVPPAKKAEAAKPSAKWNCSACGKVLGPLSLSKGTGILLEDKLLCVDCMKPSSRRKPVETLSPKTLALTAAGGVAVVALTAVFFPGQVLFAVLLTSAGATVLGLVGKALNRFVRIAVIVTGIGASAAAALGIHALREHTVQVKTESLVAREGDEVKDDLKNDCALEAQRRIEALEFKVQNGHGESSLTPRHIEELKGQLDAWLHQNYGTLSPGERALFFTLLRKYGSRTSNSTRRVRALKLDDKSVQLTLALDPAPDEAEPNSNERVLNLKDGPQQTPVSATGNSTLDKALEIIDFLLDQQPQLETVALQLVASDGSELAAISLDGPDLQTLRQHDATPLLKFAEHTRELSH